MVGLATLFNQQNRAERHGEDNLFYYQDCSSHDVTLKRLYNVIAAEQVETPVEVVKLETGTQAHKLHHRIKRLHY